MHKHTRELNILVLNIRTESHIAVFLMRQLELGEISPRHIIISTDEKAIYNSVRRRVRSR